MPQLNAIAVIPARFASTRFPGKPLKEILGKPLLQWVIEGCQSNSQLSQVIVATDHDGIAKLATQCGAEVAMTDPDLPSGSDRVWAAVKDKDFDVVLNIQGDEPLIESSWIDALVEPFNQEPGLDMATLGRPMDEEALHSQQTAKIVLNHKSEALYFSRFPIPFSRQKDLQDSAKACLKHIGLYAYSKTFLQKFCQQPPVALEAMEGLEQLRALYLGGRIHVSEVEFDSWGVDTPEDIGKVEEKLKQRN